MTRTIKTALIVLIVALGALLGAKQLHLLPGGSAAKTGGDEAAPTAEVINGPLSGLPIRFDGHYRTESGDVIRLMRYFPEGRVVLINGTRLARLMIQNEVGVRARKTYTLRSVDEDYFI